MKINLRQTALIAKREYLENVKTRGFWIGLLLLPVIMMVMASLPILLSGQSVKSKFSVIDNSGWLSDQLLNTIVREDLSALVATFESYDIEKFDYTNLLFLTIQGETELQRSTLLDEASALLAVIIRDGGQINSTSNTTEELVSWWLNNQNQVEQLIPDANLVQFPYVSSPNNDQARLQSMLLNDELMGYFIIPDDPVASNEGAQYVTKSLTNRDLRNWYQGRITARVIEQRLREENIPAITIERIQTKHSFEVIQLKESGEVVTASVSDTLQQWAPAIFVYLLWISIFSVTQMLLTNTVEEKSNRLVEVLLSSVEAIDLMSGKILGVAATGFTVVLFWMTLFGLFVAALPWFVNIPAEIDLWQLVEQPLYLGSFIVYFLLGYFFYAALLVAIGSLCNTLKEAQTLMMPIQLFLFIPLIVVIPIARDPSGALAQMLSWVPPLTPFIMMNRAAMPPGIATYVFTSLLLVVSIWLALSWAGRVFEKNVLATSKPPKMSAFFRALPKRLIGPLTPQNKTQNKTESDG